MLLEVCAVLVSIILHINAAEAQQQQFLYPSPRSSQSQQYLYNHQSLPLSSYSPINHYRGIGGGGDSWIEQLLRIRKTSLASISTFTVTYSWTTISTTSTVKLSCTTSTSALTECSRKRRQWNRKGLFYAENDETAEEGGHFLSAPSIPFSNNKNHYEEHRNERVIQNSNPIITDQKQEELSGSIMWSPEEFLRNDNKLAPGLHGVLASNKRVFLVFTVATYTTEVYEATMETLLAVCSATTGLPTCCNDDDVNCDPSPSLV